MFTQQKPSIARALRRNYTMLSPPTSSPASSSSSPPQRAWIHLRSVFLVIASSPVTDDRGSLKSPWSRRRRKHALLPKQWNSLFDADGRFCDGGVKFLKKVRSGGVDPTLRAEVWPFLLGIYELNSSKEERATIRMQKREEYDKLRDECVHVSKRTGMSSTSDAKSNINEESGELSQVMDPPSPGEVNNDECTASSLYKEHKDTVLPDCSPTRKDSDKLSAEEVDESEITTENASDSDSSDFGNDQNNLENDNKEKSQSPELGTTPKFSAEKVGESEITTENASDSDFSDIGNDQTNLKNDNKEKSPSPELGTTQKSLDHEEFSTWQRIIRLDAVRANAEWVNYSPSQSSVSETKARELADSVGLKDYDHLEPCRIFHAARLVAILEAYTLYDPEIGYCQGMSDLLSPIISVIEDDFEAFWCFVGFMRKARHNFRLDEVGIRKQLSMVSKIIKYKDSHLYSHLEKLEAQDCFFVYRMVVVLFRRELNLEQIYCLWEVMWADQASIRANIGKSDFGRMRVRAPPSDDLLLYAIAACVLQRRKIIIENFSSMDEIMRECNGMAGRLDVWKLLDDAHDLVVNLHNKI